MHLEEAVCESWLCCTRKTVVCITAGVSCFRILAKVCVLWLKDNSCADRGKRGMREGKPLIPCRRNLKVISWKAGRTAGSCCKPVTGCSWSVPAQHHQKAHHLLGHSYFTLIANLAMVELLCFNSSITSVFSLRIH